jgi:LacI family repressor for deo operon, udp, cdd, tsx, nupC, and nupG
LILRDQLISHLIESGAAPGDTFCSDTRLMTLSGLSRTTVRKALDELCSAGWIDRRSGVGSFVGPRVMLHRPMATLPPQREDEQHQTVRVAVLLHMCIESSADFFTRGVLQGLDSVALENGLSVELVGDSNTDVQTLIKRLRNGRADVLVVMPSTARHAVLEGAAEGLGIPCLMAGSHLFESGMPTVYEDGSQGTALAVRHLFERGHRRIGLWLSQAPAIWVHQRRAGYMEALDACGLAPDERLVLWTPYSPTAANTQLTHVPALQAYLEKEKPTALVIASSGQHTRTLGEWQKKTGKRIPEDLSVVFLDQNYEEYARLLHRQPTVIKLPLVEIGQNLARLARETFDAAAAQAEPPPPALIALPCTLTEGDSVSGAIQNG